MKTRPRAIWACWTIAKYIVTISGVKWTIKKFRPFKSPGIFLALLQEHPDHLHKLLCELFRASLAWVWTWGLNRVAFIPKRVHQSTLIQNHFIPLVFHYFFWRLFKHWLRDTWGDTWGITYAFRCTFIKTTRLSARKILLCIICWANLRIVWLLRKLHYAPSSILKVHFIINLWSHGVWGAWAWYWSYHL